MRIADVTGAWACFGLWGPRARDVLAPLTPAGPVDAAFPYLTMQETTVGDVPVRALRVTYVGELGWELYCPAEYGAGLWRTLVEAGAPHGLRPAGYRAIESLRLEKGYRVWGSDVTRDTTPDEAGLAFAVRPGDGYAGAAALAAARARGTGRGGCAAWCSTDPRAVALGVGAGARGGAPTTSAGSSPRVATATPSSGRSPTPCSPPRSARGPRCRCRSTGSGWTARSSGGRCTTRRASGCGPDPAACR